MTVDLTEICKEIEGAVKTLSSTSLRRVDGDNFKAYRVGEVIRIDITLPKEQ